MTKNNLEHFENLGEDTMRKCTYKEKSFFKDTQPENAKFHGFYQFGDNESGLWVCAVIEFENGAVKIVEADSIKFVLQATLDE